MASPPPTQAATSADEMERPSREITPTLPLTTTTVQPLQRAISTNATTTTATTSNKKTHPTMFQPWYSKKITPGSGPGSSPGPGLLSKSSPQNSNPNSALNLISQQQHQGILYPAASSGHGFVARPKFDQSVTVANLGGPARSSYLHHQVVRPYGLHNSDAYLTRPAYLHPSQSQPPIPIKVANFTSTAPAGNGITDSRERIRDETSVMVRDRKVRISDSSSLYALCRSWLKNGFHEETQPIYRGAAISLPRPPPTQLLKENDGEKEDGEANKSVDHLSEKELLQRHIKRAKKVRSQLREERLRRIARYKHRLGILLPPQGEQFRDETGA